MYIVFFFLILFGFWFIVERELILINGVVILIDKLLNGYKF